MGDGVPKANQITECFHTQMNPVCLFLNTKSIVTYQMFSQSKQMPLVILWIGGGLKPETLRPK